MNDFNPHTIREFCPGVVECRICGLKFVPDLEEDREEHELQHMRILWRAMPYDVREFIKRAAWTVLHDPNTPPPQPSTINHPSSIIHQPTLAFPKTISNPSWPRTLRTSTPNSPATKTNSTKPANSCPPGTNTNHYPSSNFGILYAFDRLTYALHQALKTFSDVHPASMARIEADKIAWNPRS